MRLPGWELRLSKLIEDARTRPYELGTWDCFRLVCLVVQALTGVDRWPEFAGYKTKREALVKISRHGKSFEAAGDWFFGGPSINVRFASRGDICAIQTEDKEKHLGIVMDSRVAFMAPEGLIYIPVMTCPTAWKVG